MGVVVIGGGGSGGGGGPKLTADGKTVTDGERVVAVFASASDAQWYADTLNAEARVIPFAEGLEP